MKDAIMHSTMTPTYADGSVERYGYDENGNMTTITTADGRILTYEYDGLGNVTKITYPDGTTEECTYDMLGQVISSTDVMGNKTTITYDGTGKLTGATLPNGQSVTAIYGDTETTRKQIQKLTDTSGKSVTYTYDSMGNITTATDALGNKTTCEYNQWGELLAETDANGNKTTYTYDKAGYCTAVTNPDGSVMNVTYDSCGRVSETYMESEDGERLSVGYTYDLMGNISSVTDEMGNTTSYEYDLSGNLIKVTDSQGVVTGEYTYDCMGKVLQEKTPSGIVITYSYNKSDLVEKATMTSPTGEEKIYTYTYDDMGRVLTVTDPAGNVSSQVYDKAGNITELVYPEGGGISYTYDSLSRLTEEKLSIGTTTKYNYNSDGLLDEIVNGRNQSLKVNYDVLGRISSTSDQLGTVSYTYDGNGNILTVSEIDKSGKTSTISRTYDCMNRVTSYTDYKGNTVKYGYDELGNLITLTYPGGEIVRYSYDKAGLLTTVTDDEGFVTSYTYDKVGRLHTTTKPDGSVETNTYDKLSRLTERVVVGKDGVLVNKYTYTYDSWGNVVSMGYESSFEGDASTTTFTSASMTYDSSNRMVTYNGEDILYDADGNMLYGPLDGVMTEFEYDCRNRLVRAGDTYYEYDAENIRIATETPDYREEYVTDTVSELSRVLVITREYKTGNKNETEKYYYGNGLIYEKSSEVGLLVYHYNHLGSTTAITDANGELVYSYDYGTYGELTTTTEYDQNTPIIRFLYNGQLGVSTDDNGLYYMRQRYYNPQIKRFINQDILTGSIGNSASLNRYSYVEGNPVSYTDPFGLSPFSYISQPMHTVLDWLGVIPGIGKVFDVINASIYLMEGKPSYALFALMGSPGLGDGLSFLIKNGKKSLVGATIIALFTQTDAGTGLKDDIGNIVNDYITYNGYEQMSPEELVFALTLESFWGVKSGIDDLDFRRSKADVDVDDFVPDNATNLNRIDGDDLVPDNAAGAISRADADDVVTTTQGYGGCFVEGTEIKTIDGDKNIEDVHAGDKVYSKNTETGEEGYKEVVRVFKKKTYELVYLTVGEEEIITTPNHPFYVVGAGFVEAGNLQIGDEVETADGEILKIRSITIEYLDEPIQIFNFEVADWHTYYVSEEEVLVHNMCSVDPTNATNKRGVGGKGWRGDKTWKNNVNKVREGDTILDFDGQIPTEQEAIDLINEAGGTVTRIEGPHMSPNPHDFKHINYVTSTGKKGTIRIQ